MENNIVVRDTIYNYTLDSICTIGVSCKLHTHKVIKEIIVHTIKPYTYTNEVDGHFMTFYVNEFGETFQIDNELVNEQENSTNFEVAVNDHGIEPCNSDLLIRGDLRSASEIIGILPSKQNIMQHNDLNNEITGALFAMMLFLTIIYVLNTYKLWVKMVSEIRFALKS